ncbi:MAG: DUF1659 domain-containing protein [Epulopiscium sp.]|nr:DUF1659 domain-containing protein [Candidatus Epulonipiscium sp.]
MAVVGSVVGTKLSLQFKDGDKTVSKTYSNLKTSAKDQDIFNAAGTIASLSERPVEMVKKIVETELEDI